MTHIITKEQYLAVIATWKKTKSHSSEEHIIYNALRGLDPKRGFTPTINTTKLSNGADEWAGYEHARTNAIWSMRDPDLRTTRFDTQARILIRTEQENARMKRNNERFGIELTQEIRNTIMDLIK